MVSIQVVNRHLIQQSIPWTEELTRISYILLIFIGCVLATINDAHVKVSTIKNKLSTRVSCYLDKGISITCGVFFSVCSYGNYSYMMINWGAEIPTVPFIEVGYLFLIVFICTFLMAGIFFLKAFQLKSNNSSDEII
ncbi:TRAP transporter small permease [Vibrio penaeicida]|uniref:TRAP transporter small permease n=1 Tax=Vibrio penaeicida TaxID=104609 RepID=UPI00351F65BD